MQNMHARHSVSKRAARRGAHGWVVACSFLMAAFTVFVLLDAFAIERVQQSVQEANLTSIIEAQADEQTGESAELDSQTNVEASPSDDDDAVDEAAADQAAAGSGAHSGHGARAGSGKGPGKHVGATGNTATSVEEDTVEAGAGSAASAGTTIGSYSDENMSITVSQVRAYDTDIYVADIQVTSAEYLKTALAQNAFGRNLKDTTSNMAAEADAVLAVNGDYYGFRDNGYVLRNGVLYRDTAAEGADALVVYGDGSMASASQDTTTAQQLVDAGAWQVLSFGPALVENGALAVNAGDEVDQSMGSNPRTAIGMVSPLHYIVVVSDGRTGDNEGLSLYQLAQVMLDNGATYAYNLDGGGSTTLWFQGEILNNPTSGNKDGERQVSDIVYFG